MQRAGDSSTYLLEAVSSASAGATSAGGIFAFASRAGLEAFFGDESVSTVAAESRFDLIIGLDAITDTRAIEWLIEAEESLEGLSVAAFLHARRSTLFHPKLCWFERPDGLVLLTGSGNLTLGGLRGNWEAFSRSDLQGSDAHAVLTSISEWREAEAERLLPLADSRVWERAALNARQNALLRDRLRRPEEIVVEIAALLEEGDQQALVPPGLPVLIAEIPAAGNRWNQANFDRATYEGFFGARVGTTRRILLRHVGSDASLGDIETRPSVAVASHNYRFELAAARGVDYPDDGRPIALFLRTENGVFLYSLLLPGDASELNASAFLDERWEGPASRVRRVRSTAAELRAAWPDSPLLTAAADVATEP